MINKSEGLDLYISGIRTLPTAPGTLIKLIALFQQPDRDIDDVAGLIRVEPSLTAGLLRHANSASFMLETPVVDVFDAIIHVGFTEVYKAIVAKLAAQSMWMAGGSKGINIDELWNHSVIAGVCAGAIAKRAGENEGLTFTAGILHDVGKIILSSAEGQKYATLAAKFGGGGVELELEEEKLFGFGHSAVGAFLLGRWGLPEEISSPVRHHHHDHWVQPGERVCAAVCLGNIVAHAGEAKAPEKHYDSREAVNAMSLLKLSKDDLDKLLRDSQKDIDSMTKVFGAKAK